LAATTIRWAGVRLTMEGAQEFKKSMADINNQLKTSQANLNKVTNGFAKNETNAKTLAAQQKHLKEAFDLNAQAIALTQQKITEATNAFGENSSEAIALRRELAFLEAEQERLNTAMSATQRAIDGQRWTKLSGKLEVAGSRIQAVGEKMTQAGKTLSVAVTAPLVALGTQAVRVGKDFESSMIDIRTSTRMTAEETEELTREFRTLATTSDIIKFSARDIANAYYTVARAGNGVYHATELMRYSMVLAAAKNTDLASAAGFLDLALMKNQAELSESERYINAFATVASESGMSLNNLQKAIVNLAPTMNITNTSIEAMSAKLNELYRGGLYGINAARGIEQMTNALLDGSDALTKMGISAFDLATGQMRPLNDVLYEVMTYLDGVANEQERYNLQSGLFTTIYSRQVFDQLKNNREAWKDSIDVMYEATSAVDGTGRAFEMAATRQEGMRGSLSALRVSFEEIKLQIAQQLMPIAQRLIDKASRVIDRFSNLDEATQRNVVRFGAMAAAVGPVLVIGGKLTTKVGKIVTSFSAMTGAIGAAGGAKAAFAKNMTLSTAAATKYSTAVNAATGKLTLKTKALAAASLGVGKYTTVLGAGGAKLKAYSAGLAAKAAGMTGLKAKMAAGTAGVLKFNAALLANPKVAVVAGILAIGGAVFGLVQAFNRESEAAREVREETERVAAAREQSIISANNLRDSVIRTAETHATNTQAMEAETVVSRRLIDRIEELNSVGDKSLEQRAELATAVQTLNQNMGETVLTLNEETGAVNESIAAIRQRIDALADEARTQAQRERLVEIERERIKVYMERERLINENSEAVERLAQVTEEYYRISRESWNTDPAINSLRSLRNELRDKVEDTETAIQEMDQNYTRLSESAVTMAGIITDSYIQAAESADDFASDSEAANLRAQQAMDELVEAQSTALQSISAEYESLRGTITNMWQALSNETEKSVSQANETLENNIAVSEQWAADIERLSNMSGHGLYEGFMDYLKSLGVDSAAELRMFVYAIDNDPEGIKRLSDNFERAGESAIESLIRTLDAPEEAIRASRELARASSTALMDEIKAAQFDEKGVLVGTSYALGIDNSVDAPVASAENMARQTAESVDAFNNAVNPYMLYVNKGERVGESYALGITNKIAVTVEATRQMSKESSQGMQSAIDEANFERKGERIPEKVSTGILAKIHKSTNSMVELVNQVVQAGKNAVQNADVEGIGKNKILGIVNGMMNHKHLATTAGANIINSIINTMNQTAQISSPSRRTRKSAREMINGIIVEFKAKTSEVIAVCKQFTDKVTDSLRIDPEKIIADLQEITRAIQTSLPTLEHNMQVHTGTPGMNLAHAVAAPAQVSITFGDVYVREESDIDKIANAVLRKMGKQVDYKSRITGDRIR